MNKSSGFTLIEILVSISIVGVIFGVLITSAVGIRRTSRNAQREADLRNIQSALQQYYADQNFFPNTLTLSSSTTFTNATGNPNSPSVSKTYMKSTPIESSGSSPYVYKSAVSFTDPTVCTTTNCHYYYLCALMEGSSSQQASQYSYCATSVTPTSTYNFQLTPS